MTCPAAAPLLTNKLNESDETVTKRESESWLIDESTLRCSKIPERIVRIHKNMRTTSG